MFDLLGDLDEREIMPVLAGPEALVELLQLLVVVARFAEQREALARSRFDQAGDHQAVHQLAGSLAAADELVQLAGVWVGVGLGQAAASPGEETADDGEVFDLVARDGGHRRDPVFRRARFGPAVQQLKRVGGGLLLEVGVVVEKFERTPEDGGRPGVRS